MYRGGGEHRGLLGTVGSVVLAGGEVGPVPTQRTDGNTFKPAGSFRVVTCLYTFSVLGVFLAEGGVWLRFSCLRPR